MQENRVDHNVRLEQVQDHIDKMPSLSTTVMKVLEICNRTDTSANDMNRVISLDPVLTGKVLKLINSAYYSLPNQVTSLTRAIIILGLNTVKNLALSTAILGNLSRRKSKAIPIDAFWSHSIHAGVTAKAIASRKKIPGSLEEYFIAGLLHDLGKIPLSDCFPLEYRRAMDMVLTKNWPLYHAEKAFFGFDHCLTGRMIAEKWKLADGFVEALAFHHAPEIAAGENQDLVANVIIGNHYAHFAETPPTGDTPSPPPAEMTRALEVSGLEWTDVLALNDEIEMEIEKARIFLQIGIGG